MPRGTVLTNQTAAVGPLPRGRHALSRAEVQASQRSRLLRAMIDVVAERGYAATTAAGVYARAGVSSRAFYENFSGVDGCFLAAYDAAAAITRAALEGEAREPAPEPLDHLQAILHTYLKLVQEQPAVARTFLVEVYAAGPAALARRLAVHRRFVEVITGVLFPGGEPTSQERALVAGLVDAVTFAVTLRVAARDLDQLDQLEHDLMLLARRVRRPTTKDRP